MNAKIKWVLLNKITVNGIKLNQIYKSQITQLFLLCVSSSSYCYQSVYAISLGLAQSDLMKQPLLYFFNFRSTYTKHTNIFSLQITSELQNGNHLYEIYCVTLQRFERYRLDDTFSTHRKTFRQNVESESRRFHSGHQVGKVGRK
jgi:hypothetical protein